MLEVDLVKQCKQLSAKGMSYRAIARELEISRMTVSAYVSGRRSPGKYQRSKRRSQPVRDPIRPLVESYLKEERDNETPRKQRLTAARIYRLLRADEFVVSESSVRQVVRETRRKLRDPLKHAYLPLQYEPGVDAQVDFFEAWVDDRNRGRVKTFALLVRACFSARCFAYIAPNQTRESLFEGLMQSFEFFGGVFHTLWFDNLTPAVKKVLKGRDRELQKKFQDFQAHYGFEANFCGPAKGNEKGGVEGEVKYSRHEIFSPIPTVAGRGEIQRLANDWMDRDALRSVRGREITIGAAWKEEAPLLMPLPPARFEAGLLRTTRVSPRSWISYGTNYYSAPVEWVDHPVDIRVRAETVEIRLRNGQSVTHPRLYGKHQMSLELDHYLPLLQRKHRGLDRAIPVRNWLLEAAPCWTALLQNFRKQQGEVDGSKSFVEALFLCRLRGADAMTKAIQRTLGHPEISIGTLRYFLRLPEEQQTSSVASIEVNGPAVQPCTASVYMALCSGHSA